MSTEQKINKESKASKSSEKEEEINIADILQLIWSNRYTAVCPWPSATV